MQLEVINAISISTRRHQKKYDKRDEHDERKYAVEYREPDVKRTVLRACVFRHMSDNTREHVRNVKYRFISQDAVGKPTHEYSLVIGTVDDVEHRGGNEEFGDERNYAEKWRMHTVQLL